MAFNGAGTFARIYNWVADKANNVKITASRMDTEMDGFATGLSTCLTKDGQTQPTADLPMNSHRHTGVAAGTARTHYADVGSEQDGLYHWCGTAGGTANALTLTPSPAITAYVAGQVFRFTAGASPNAGATTIAVSGLAAKAVQRLGVACIGGEIAANTTHEVLYDGTQFQLMTASAIAAGPLTVNIASVTGKNDVVSFRQDSGYSASESHNLVWNGAGPSVLGRWGVEYDGTDCWLYARDLWGNGAVRIGISFAVKGTNGTPANYVYTQAAISGNPALIGTNADNLIIQPTGGSTRVGGGSLVTQSALTCSGGSFSVNGADTNFAAGNNRAVMDAAGGYARIGGVNGGASAHYLKLLSNNATVLTIDAAGTVFSSSAGNVTATGDYLPDAANTRNVGSSSLYYSRIYSKRLSLLDSDNSNTVEITHSGNLTANRSLNLDLSDASRNLAVTADATISGSPVIQGTHEFYVDAGAMLPAITNGPSAGTTETTTNKVNYATLDFDQTTQEFAHFKVRMPKSWNNGTVTFIPHWGAASSSGGVVWALQAVAVSDGDALDAAFGTEQTSTDTLIATADLQTGPESSAITIAGSPASGDVIYFRVKRNPADASDTLAADAKLHGIAVRMTISAASDA